MTLLDHPMSVHNLSNLISTVSGNSLISVKARPRVSQNVRRRGWAERDKAVVCVGHVLGPAKSKSMMARDLQSALSATRTTGVE